ncbi:Importin N-terminal domain-containing protein [Mycena indigotica]|uniref:Importin N-terminal domain-containing protein n=1 Tax=Mycena indigotica TaxID=2126181 RepID=A0A8H6S8U8_9AGAR|nr:Importin N-terminal domain-containing protein [Mycena indigotica]KAF7295071.1 Importin N-terminal domain-containing protein [Mycena indigotica]
MEVSIFRCTNVALTFALQAILDFSRDFDVSLMDRVSMAFYKGTGPEQAAAQEVLTRFQENTDAWTRVPDILERSTFSQSKYIALQILDKLISTRWKALPDGQRQGIRNFIVGLTVKVASDEATMRKEKTFVDKLDLTLVQILKQEWPHNWPSFITELVASSKTNLSLCENNMIILKLLSEEIFDYSAEQMTQTKIKNLKNQMCGEFSEIFKLCQEVLEEAQKSSLIKATLETLLRFLNWIPLGYIFETTIIDLLLNRFLEAPDFRNVTLQCLAVIAALKVGVEYDPKFVILFQMVMTSINRMIPPSTNISDAYNAAGDAGQELVLNLSLFLSNFLSNHLRVVEGEATRDVLLNAHLYMVKVSQVDEREIFKICLEYWLKLVSDLYEEISSLPVGESGILMGLNLGSGAPQSMLGTMSMRKNIYNDVLSNLRLVVIERMVKPEEVLIVENDEGEIVREFMKESDTIVLYKSMRELLVYLTHLDVSDTESLLTEKLAKQVDGSEWSWNNLNTLCWAIGSISGAMNEESEKRFLVTVIKDLLGLCEIKRGKDNKAVVASNIMYIVGQYPRFLKAHWKFLKTVVNKLFEFMHETHEGVQDMACDTFIKIATKCRRHFVVLQSGETEPFIDDILRSLHRITVDLSPQQVHTFYQAVGWMISAQPNKPQQEKLIAKLMELPNNAWDSLMAQAAQNMDVLANLDNIKILSNVLKTNVSACTSIGSFYLPQIGRIFLDMLGLYKAVSGIISETVAKEGSIATKTPKIRQLRTVKKEILKLMDTHVNKAVDLESMNANFMPPLLEAILGDYSRNVPAARDAEVLNVMASITSCLANLLTPQVPAILDAVFEPTLNMINQDFAEYPEHRTGFYKLLKAINLSCFPALLTMTPPQFKLFMDSINWAIKHTMRDIADIGLGLCFDVINNFAGAETTVANGFFQQYFLSIVQDIFFVLTDADHKSGFRLQSQVLQRMFQLVEINAIQVPLYDPSQMSEPVTNAVFLRQYSVDLLHNAFPHVQKTQVESFMVTLGEQHNDINQFKLALRDFLIQLKEFSGDNAELYLEEKEAETQRKAEEEHQQASRIPGMLKPSQMDDEDI